MGSATEKVCVDVVVQCEGLAPAVEAGVDEIPPLVAAASAAAAAAAAERGVVCQPALGNGPPWARGCTNLSWIAGDDNDDVKGKGVRPVQLEADAWRCTWGSPQV